MLKRFEIFNFKFASGVSFITVLPFISLELFNRRGYGETFPFPLFIIIWLLPLAFIYLLTPLLPKNPAGKKLMKHPLLYFLRITLLIIIAFFWMGIVFDQLPCFMGSLNCD